MKKPPLAALHLRRNGPLIKAVFDLYELDGARVLDPTYGKGNWWTEVRPERLTFNDRKLDETFDFQAMPYPDGAFDVVAFDPPYLPQGGRETSTQPDFLDRFGLVDVPKTPQELRALIRNGMAEAYRVLDRGGLALVKCMNYVNGAQHRPQVTWTIVDAIELGFRVETQFVHVSGTGPQPKLKADGSPRAVRSPRANYSVLVVLRKPGNARIGSSLFEACAS